MRVVVFGAGYFGINYIRELGRHLVGVVDPDPERLELVHGRYHVPVAAQLPDDWEFDGAIICTPPAEHINTALPLAAQGKYLLLEKPMATSVEEALKLHSRRERIMAGLIYLYHPGVLELKRKLPEMPLDHIFTRRTNDGPVREWQSAAWDLAAHDIAICNYLMGQVPFTAQAFGTRDWAMLKLDYITCSAAIYISWTGGPKTRTVELVPAQGGQRVIFDDMAQTLEVSPLRRMLDDFLTGHWDSRASFNAGLDVVSVLESMGV